MRLRRLRSAVAADAAMAVFMVREAFTFTDPPCRCGDTRDDHRHFRRGSDCRKCPCPRFHRDRHPTTREANPDGL